MDASLSFRLLLFGYLILARTGQSFGQINSFYKFNEEIDSLFLDKEQYSFAAWNYSFIGEYKKALEAYEKTSRKDNHSISDMEVALLLSDYSTRPAAEYIIERSKNERIIIINEAHHQPLHRVFTASLLQGLYESGFRYLGLEALAEDSLLNIRKWPQVGDGYYTSEPQFGNLIREASRLGFTLFGYESPEKGRERELGQAKNILTILEKDPDAKILIHCGFGHVVEDGHPSLGKAMAGLVGELAGIDPFTIDQVEFSERSQAEHESVFYKNLTIDRATVFVDHYNQPLHYRPDSAYVDISVFHPRTRFISGRPDWLLRSNSWKAYQLEEDLDLTFPCRIAAFHPAENTTNAVPVDLVELDAIHQKALILPPGDFILHIVDLTGNTKIKKITVFD